MNLAYSWFILKLCAYRKMNQLRILESTREARVNPYAAFVLSLYFLCTLYLDSRRLTDEPIFFLFDPFSQHCTIKIVEGSNNRIIFSVYGKRLFKPSIFSDYFPSLQQTFVCGYSETLISSAFDPSAYQSAKANTCSLFMFNYCFIFLNYRINSLAHSCEHQNSIHHATPGWYR